MAAATLPKENLSEASLLAMLRANERAGYEYLYDHYSRSLYIIICKVVSDEDTADDVLQEVFIKIWNNIGKYDAQKGKLYAWMVSLSRNLAIDKTRTKEYNYEKRKVASGIARSYMQTLSVKGINTDHVGIKDIVGKLKINERRLVELSFYQGYSQAQIASEYGIPLGTVKSRLHKATANLRLMLTD
jgi:RNA polymerase sigma-70 factor (ECF subfamily)